MDKWNRKAIILLASGSVFAQALAPANAETPKPAAAPIGTIPFIGGDKARIDAIKRLPGSDISIVESAGSTYFLSANGRYALRGEAWDLWNAKPIHSVTEATRVAGHIDLDHMGLNIGDLTHFDYGTGKRDVVVFLDPRCPHCKATLRQMNALAQDYRFRIVPVPVLGRKSQVLMKHMGCSPAAARDKVTKALMNDAYDTLPAEEPNCDLAPLQRVLVTAQIIGIRGVPYLIAPDGRISEGEPAGELKAWLEQSGD